MNQRVNNRKVSCKEFPLDNAIDLKKPDTILKIKFFFKIYLEWMGRHEQQVNYLAHFHESFHNKIKLQNSLMPMRAMLYTNAHHIVLQINMI